nr:MAG TPA: hypothetical protein [Caudoviricetes sp.]
MRIGGTLVTHLPIRRVNPHIVHLKRLIRGGLLLNQEVGGIEDDRSILRVI